MGPGFAYEEFAPPPALRDVVACLWRSRVAAGAAHVQRVLPDGCVELVQPAEGPALVYGPDAAWADVPLAPGGAYRGIRLRPGAGRALLRVDLDELAGRVVPAEDVIAAGDGLLAALHRRRREQAPPDAVALAAARRLADEPRLRVSELARCLAISERQLRRRFERSVGLAPATFARVARMHRALRAAANGRQPWSAIAYEAGFADQAHLGRELLALTGRRPSALVS